jgi:hypothetical protein
MISIYVVGDIVELTGCFFHPVSHSKYEAPSECGLKLRPSKKGYKIVPVLN